MSNIDIDYSCKFENQGLGKWTIISPMLKFQADKNPQKAGLEWQFLLYDFYECTMIYPVIQKSSGKEFYFISF